MKYCVKCGAEVFKEDKFCAKCGEKMSNYPNENLSQENLIETAKKDVKILENEEKKILFETRAFFCQGNRILCDRKRMTQFILYNDGFSFDGMFYDKNEVYLVGISHLEQGSSDNRDVFFTGFLFKSESKRKAIGIMLPIPLYDEYSQISYIVFYKIVTKNFLSSFIDANKNHSEDEDLPLNNKGLVCEKTSWLFNKKRYFFTWSELRNKLTYHLKVNTYPSEELFIVKIKVDETYISVWGYPTDICGPVFLANIFMNLSFGGYSTLQQYYDDLDNYVVVGEKVVRIKRDSN